MPSLRHLADDDVYALATNIEYLSEVGRIIVLLPKCPHELVSFLYQMFLHASMIPPDKMWTRQVVNTLSPLRFCTLPIY